MANIHIKKFDAHYNRAMGKVITSERQYKEEMKRGGYVPQRQADAIAKAARAKTQRAYTPSDKSRAIINSLNKDKKGNVKLSDRAIDGLKSMGVTFDQGKVKEMTSGPNMGDK